MWERGPGNAGRGRSKLASYRFPYNDEEVLPLFFIYLESRKAVARTGQELRSPCILSVYFELFSIYFFHRILLK